MSGLEALVEVADSEAIFRNACDRRRWELDLLAYNTYTQRPVQLTVPL